MFSFISRNVITGLVTLLPILLTLYLLYWLVVSAESVVGEGLRMLLPEGQYWPGMGVVAGLLGLFGVGVLMHALLVRRLFARVEEVFSYMPVVKPVYRAMKDFFDYFSPEKEQEFDQVVAVTIGEMKLVGFVTQNQPEKFPKGLDDEAYVLVYLPLSYMIGGYAVLIPRKSVMPLEMSMEEAMRFTLTAGVTSTESRSPRRQVNGRDEA